MKFKLTDFPPQNFRDNATAPIITAQVEVIEIHEDKNFDPCNFLKTTGTASNYEGALANAYRDMIHLLADKIQTLK